jgi:hypothetical protein
LAVGPVVPADGHWNTNNERTYSAAFVQAQIKAGTLHRVTVASRLVPLLECALLALSLYALASLLFGVWAGVVAGLLWLLDPLVLGLGHLDGVGRLWGRRLRSIDRTPPGGACPWRGGGGGPPRRTAGRGCLRAGRAHDAGGLGGGLGGVHRH